MLNRIFPIKNDLKRAEIKGADEREVVALRRRLDQAQKRMKRIRRIAKAVAGQGRQPPGSGHGAGHVTVPPGRVPPGAWTAP